MKTTLHCKFFGHDLRLKKHVTDHVKEYKCKNCKKEFTTNGSGNLTELTPEFKEINEVLELVYNNKIKRSNSELFDNLLVFKH